MCLVHVPRKDPLDLRLEIRVPDKSSNALESVPVVEVGLPRVEVEPPSSHPLIPRPNSTKDAESDLAERTGRAHDVVDGRGSVGNEVAQVRIEPRVDLAGSSVLPDDLQADVFCDLRSRAVCADEVPGTTDPLHAREPVAQ